MNEVAIINDLTESQKKKFTCGPFTLGRIAECLRFLGLERAGSWEITESMVKPWVFDLHIEYPLKIIPEKLLKILEKNSCISMITTVNITTSLIAHKEIQ